MAYFADVKSPKSIAFPVVANSIYSIVFFVLGSSYPPDITPLVDDEVAFVILLAALKFPKSVESPRVAIVTNSM